tara:strand:+ start:430 stop:1329 length:900 start_codon:yes stop_codon:yes gene_type:complete
MNYSNKSVVRHLRGFTIIELLVVIAIIVIIVSILTPSLGRAFRSARSTEDKTQARGIHSSMLLYSTTNNGDLPRPSVIGKGHDNIQHEYSDTTANLMSFMLARNYFNTDTLISPTESNPNVQDMNAMDLAYDYKSIDGEYILWDTEFVADVSSATPASPAHNSYAHQALCGERVRLKWNAGASSSDIAISNRGPEVEIADGEMSTNEDSFTMKFHGREDAWLGVIVGGDGSARLAGSIYPDEVAYKPLNGSPLGPDNLFYTDWNDINIPSVPPGMASGDNWLVICDEVLGENEIIAVWD